MKSKKTLCLILTAALALCLALSGCAAGNDNSASSAVSEWEKGASESAYEDGFLEEEWDGFSQEELPQEETAAGEVAGLPQKLIYTADASLETKDIQAALAAIRQELEKAGGVVQSENLYNLDAGALSREDYGYSRGMPSAELTVRVLSEKFKSFMTGLQSDPDLIYARSVTSETENLTRIYYDLEARVQALKAEESWLLDFMEQAETVTEMLEIKDRLTDVQQEIDTLTNRMTNIDYDADWSTVSIYLTQVERYSEKTESTFGERLGGYFSTSGENFLDTMEGLLEFLILALPYLVILAVGAVILIACLRASNKKRRKKMEALLTANQPREDPPQE